VDFSDGRELFVNIFQITGPNCKIMDCGLIFGKTEGPKCKMPEFRIFRNYFPKGNPWTVSGAGPRWTTVNVSEEAHRRTAGTASP
jgi:hypothetical protein